MSIEENKARYEGSFMQALMKHAGHHVCERCYCCDSTQESSPCWQCGGMEPDYDDEWDDGWCETCQGEREVYFWSCLGNCDEFGDHEPAANRPQIVPENSEVHANTDKAGAEGGT